MPIKNFFLVNPKFYFILSNHLPCLSFLQVFIQKVRYNILINFYLLGVSRHWPINGKWHNLSYVYEIFTHEKLPVLDSSHEKLFGQIIEFKHQVNTIIPKDSKLLQGVYLPLVLQCNELAKSKCKHYIHLIVLYLHYCLIKP